MASATESAPELHVTEHGIARQPEDSFRNEFCATARTIATWRRRHPDGKVKLVDPLGGEHVVDLGRWKDADPLTLVAIWVQWQEPDLVGTKDPDAHLPWR